MMYAYYRFKDQYFKICYCHDKLISLSLVNYIDDKNIPNDFSHHVYSELEEYFHHQRTSFDIPLLLEGTAFQKKVWNALLSIPYGHIVSYQEIASMIGHPKSARAVGGAIHHNPVMIIVPCHRVIGSDGSLTGYAYGIELKKELLALEAMN
ncbi:methylated-DNA--[protein]-cysteine S-methyltransferase [Eggerthia catenaformis]|uniref:methylated-DNA--[protein]-cysteine S-methyltransferase n=1 Tax=Eggerthia catenaformis TaxID=31973 RepID=UPI0028E5B845|nr:methylated-DNA--[protein]-cysteine S-methyltransferase [Eggerthia catenaformis]